MQGKVELGAYAAAAHGRGAHLLCIGPWSLWWVGWCYPLTPTQGRCASLGLPQVYLPWRQVTTELHQVSIHCWVNRVMGLRKIPRTAFSLRSGFEAELSRLSAERATTAPHSTHSDLGSGPPTHLITWAHTYKVVLSLPTNVIVVLCLILSLVMHRCQLRPFILISRPNNTEKR